MKSTAARIGAMSEAEKGHLFPIILSAYQPRWPKRYQKEKARLLRAVGPSVLRIHHIGSTSVPGLWAKPTIDILMEIEAGTDLKKFISAIKKCGYLYSEQPLNPAPHMMFMKGYTLQGFKGQAFHLHVRYQGDWKELYFRDYLRKHPETAAAYAALKQALKTRYEYDRNAYTEAKTAFCTRIADLGRQAFPERYRIPDKALRRRIALAETFEPTGHCRWSARPWGGFFYDPENPTYYDANHAIVTAVSLTGATLREITRFYRYHKMTPRLYDAFVPHALTRWQATLVRHGFAITPGSATLFIHARHALPPRRHDLTIRQVTVYDEVLFKSLLEPDEWAYRLPALKQDVIRPEFHMYVAFDATGQAVASAVRIELRGGLFRIDEVETPMAHRGHGYARSLINEIVCRHYEDTDGLLYLWAENPTAIRIYEEAGFRRSDLLPCAWSAYLKS